VLSARVHISLPPKELLPGTTEPEKPTASVLVRHRGVAPPITSADVQQLVAGAVSGLAPAQVTVVLATSPPVKTADRELLRFGPVTTTRGSLMPLRLTVAGVVLLNLVLVGALIWLFRRLRRTELALDEAKALPR
jgi:type III secretory pathway lipoprotein EscJ